MPAKNARAESGGFSAGERAAMKEHAAELRAEGARFLAAAASDSSASASSVRPCYSRQMSTLSGDRDGLRAPDVAVRLT
jgi:hypothetical protein